MFLCIAKLTKTNKKTACKVSSYLCAKWPLYIQSHTYGSGDKKWSYKHGFVACHPVMHLVTWITVSEHCISPSYTTGRKEHSVREPHFTSLMIGSRDHHVRAPDLMSWYV